MKACQHLSATLGKSSYGSQYRKMGRILAIYTFYLFAEN